MKMPYDHPELAHAILNDFITACEENDIEYFITRGTLLGFYRDGDWIPSDCDIDVAVVYSLENWDKIWNILPEYNLASDRGGNHVYKHYWRDDMLLDITWVEAEGFYARSETFNNWPVPSPIEDYLAWRYGETWRTPMTTGYELQHEE